jgi:hypothetical protein
MDLQKVMSKKTDILKVTDEKSRIRIRLWISKSVVRYGSADPDPYQNVKDQHTAFYNILFEGHYL